MSIIKPFPNKTGVDLTGKEGYAVKYDTSGLALCSALTDKAVGIVTRGDAKESDVCVFGECLAKAGAPVTRGKHIIPHTDGTVKDTAASSQELGVALESGVAGDLVQVIVLGITKANA